MSFGGVLQQAPKIKVALFKNCLMYLFIEYVKNYMCII